MLSAGVQVSRSRRFFPEPEPLRREIMGVQPTRRADIVVGGVDGYFVQRFRADDSPTFEHVQLVPEPYSLSGARYASERLSPSDYEERLRQGPQSIAESLDYPMNHDVTARIFTGSLLGLVLVEAVFTSTEAGLAFRPSDTAGVGQEVTGESMFRSVELAGRSYDDLATNLTALGYTAIDFRGDIAAL